MSLCQINLLGKAIKWNKNKEAGTRQTTMKAWKHWDEILQLSILPFGIYKSDNQEQDKHKQKNIKQNIEHKI